MVEPDSAIFPSETGAFLESRNLVANIRSLFPTDGIDQVHRSINKSINFP